MAIFFFFFFFFYSHLTLLSPTGMAGDSICTLTPGAHDIQITMIRKLSTTKPDYHWQSPTSPPKHPTPTMTLSSSAKSPPPYSEPPPCCPPLEQCITTSSVHLTPLMESIPKAAGHYSPYHQRLGEPRSPPLSHKTYTSIPPPLSSATIPPCPPYPPLNGYTSKSPCYCTKLSIPCPGPTRPALAYIVLSVLHRPHL